MFCVKCGKEIPDNAQFCPNCGEIVSADNYIVEKETAVNNPSQKSECKVRDNSSKSIWVIVVISVISLVIILAAALLGYNFRRNIEGTWALAEIEGVQDPSEIEVPFFNNAYMTIPADNPLIYETWIHDQRITLNAQNTDFLIRIPKGHQEYTSSWAGNYSSGEITEATEQDYMLWHNGDCYFAHKDGPYIEITYKDVVFKFAKKL